MTAPVVQISRYPNRRFYDRQASKYISLGDIEELVQQGRTVEIRDNQTGEDLTRSVLTRILIDRQPEKMQLFPVDMLHFIVRSNTLMADFLRDYFRASLMYLEYLQRHGGAVSRLGTPMHWMKAWMDRLTPRGAALEQTPEQAPVEETNNETNNVQPAENVITTEEEEVDKAALLARRIEQLEERIRRMEAQETAQPGG